MVCVWACACSPLSGSDYARKKGFSEGGRCECNAVSGNGTGMRNVEGVEGGRTSTVISGCFRGGQVQIRRGEI